MKPDCKEIKHQLSESRREFLAADATINNLEMKLAEMEEHLANAESKCDALAAEKETFAVECAAAKIAIAYLKSGRQGFSLNTPATDAFMAEVECKAIRKFINSIEYILRDKLSPYDTEEMLEAMRIFLEEQE